MISFSDFYVFQTLKSILVNKTIRNGFKGGQAGHRSLAAKMAAGAGGSAPNRSDADSLQFNVLFGHVEFVIVVAIISITVI